MCGIAGIVQEGFDAVQLRRLSCALDHRGPDDHGYLIWDGRSEPQLMQTPSGRGHIGLAHRRLSILDLSENGRQPMFDATGRYAIVYNGEVYNYLELSEELKSHCFRSRTDTEVMLAAWSEYGAEALNRFAGMFAFALIDFQERKLHLARDPFGIKPLYYAQCDGRFAFASEIASLLELEWVSRRANLDRAGRYLASGVTDYGDQTFFQDVCQLPAGAMLTLDIDSAKIVALDRYFRLEDTVDASLSMEEAADRLRKAFLQSVKLHLRSDVPIGACLSGGIDSSSIVMAMRYLEGKDLEIHSFSFVPVSDAISELKWINVVGEAAELQGHLVRPSADELASDLPALVRAQQEPFSSTSVYAQYRVFKAAQEAGIKVMIDGQGADELFAGYLNYVRPAVAERARAFRFRSAFNLINSAARINPNQSRTLLGLASLLIALPDWMKRPLLRRLEKSKTPPWLSAQDASLYQHQTFRAYLKSDVTTTSLPMLLRFEDRNSMAFSIESRVPFVTPALAQIAFSLRSELLLSDSAVTKAVLREAMRPIVPDPILDRRDKIGFATDEGQWMRSLEPTIREAIERGAFGGLPFIDSRRLAAEYDLAFAGKTPLQSAHWRALNLALWSEIFDIQYS